MDCTFREQQGECLAEGFYEFRIVSERIVSRDFSGDSFRTIPQKRAFIHWFAFEVPVIGQSTGASSWSSGSCLACRTQHLHNMLHKKPEQPFRAGFQRKASPGGLLATPRFARELHCIKPKSSEMLRPKLTECLC
eukprot:5014753-Amphidinium_carterae.2